MRAGWLENKAHRPRTGIFASLLVLCLLGCRGLSIGWPTRLNDAPAPTAIPLVSGSISGGGQGPGDPAEPPRPIRLPAGFQISIFAEGLEGPRMMAVGPDGHLYVAERGAGRVVRLPDRDADGQADGVEVVAADLTSPNSLAFDQDGSLYVSEVARVLRLSRLDERGRFGQREVLIDNLPGRGVHTTRTLLIHPDGGMLFVSVGSSCNVCDEEDSRRAAIVRYNMDGTGEQIYATGLRNAVGITFRPGTQELWATNNGRDWLGDDLPPETIYRVDAGQDYGWPRCHAGRIVDPDFGSPQACDGVEVPLIEMQAHTAPLGLAFYTGRAFPQPYQGDLFVALHGSWNRSEPVGYKVVRIPISAGKPGPVEDFAVGWLADDGTRWGRPVDLATAQDGSLMVSDDGQGRVYRIFFPF